MPPRSTPLAVGESMPSLHLTTADGKTTALALPVLERTLVYFMRTSTCPVCHSHLRHIERARLTGQPLVERTVVVVPGDAESALSVENRHPSLAGRVLASETAHESVGLFVRGALQQSGSFVVEPSGKVVWARTATVPLGSYNEAEALEALTGAGG